MERILDAITGLRDAVRFLVFAASISALAAVPAIVAFAAFVGTNRGTHDTVPALLDTSGWLNLAGALLALAAVSVAAWQAGPDGSPPKRAELSMAALAGVLAAVGALVTAPSLASITSAKAQQALLSAAFALWALLAVGRALRHRGNVRSAGSIASPVTAWLIASFGLILLVASHGIGVELRDRGTGLTGAILGALGYGLLAVSLGTARAQGRLLGAPTRWVIAGLGAMGAASIVNAIGTELTFTSLGQFRTVVSIALALNCLGAEALGWAAWIRLGDIPAQMSTFHGAGGIAGDLMTDVP